MWFAGVLEMRVTAEKPAHSFAAEHCRIDQSLRVHRHRVEEMETKKVLTCLHLHPEWIRIHV